jgi:hypothetical protein
LRRPDCCSVRLLLCNVDSCFGLRTVRRGFPSKTARNAWRWFTKPSSWCRAGGEYVGPAAEAHRGRGVRDEITLDTNVVRDLLRDDQQWRKTVGQLLAPAEAGKVDLVVTRYIQDDVPGGALTHRISALGEKPPGQDRLVAPSRAPNPTAGPGALEFVTLRAGRQTGLRGGRRGPGRSRGPKWNSRLLPGLMAATCRMVGW